MKFECNQCDERYTELRNLRFHKISVHEGLKNNVVHKMDERYLQTNLVQSEEVPMMYKAP